MKLRLLKSLLLIVGLGLGVHSAAWAEEVQFTKLRQTRKLLRMDKPNDVQAIIKDLYKTKGKTDEAAPTDSTEYYFLTGLLKRYYYDKENVKLYLRQNPDTVAYFSRLYEMADAFAHCYPTLASAKKESDEVKSLLRQYRENLMRGGNFFLGKQDMGKAANYYELYIQLNDKQLINTPDSVVTRARYNAAYAASQLKEYERVLRHGNELIRRGHATEEVDLLVCEALNQLGRVDEWRVALQQALARHPLHFYFYAALIDYYIENQALDKALLYADELQKNDPMNGVKNFVKGYVYQRSGDYRNAIIWQEICERLSPGVTENLSALGYNYVAVAEEYYAALRGNYITPESKKELNGYYLKAKQYLEECRKIAPDKPQFWAPALYKVYYQLNDGDALDEIEAILRDVE